MHLTSCPFFPGLALATAGEDGSVKIWSRNGMLRSTLAQADSPVYSIVWAYDCDQLCYCTGPNVVIKSLSSSAKQNAWRAHDGVVLKVDWSPINHLIVSGGEDCKYKVCIARQGGGSTAVGRLVLVHTWGTPELGGTKAQLGIALLDAGLRSELRADCIKKAQQLGMMLRTA